jgi:hypothetical protein
MARCPKHVGAPVEYGATPEQGCRVSRARPCDCGVAGVVRTGVQRRPDGQVVPLAVRAGGASPARENDEHQSSDNVSVEACAGAGVGAGADVDVDAGAGAGADEYDCEDAKGHVHDCGYGDVGSLLSSEAAVEVAHVSPGEGDSDGGCVHVDVGASEGEGEGTGCHGGVHTSVVHEGDVHLDQDAGDLIPKSIRARERY